MAPAAALWRAIKVSSRREEEEGGAGGGASRQLKSPIMINGNGHLLPRGRPGGAGPAGFTLF